jgi:hypothetical protein
MVMNPSPKPLDLPKIRKVWILGAGFFGQRALAAVETHLKNLSDRVVVVDRNSQRLESLDADIVCGEAVEWLGTHLMEPDALYQGEDHLIIPALPLHVAAEWLRTRLNAHGKWERPPVPTELLANLPNAHPLPGGGGLTTSIATWRCPDDCPAPISYCNHTGLPRNPDLYEAMGKLHLTGWRTIVIHSRQLAPGVGGYTARQLWETLGKARSVEKKMIAATVCRCHGVIDLLVQKDADSVGYRAFSTA